MNERIKELARRVVGKHRNDTAPIWIVDEQIEKFAELLIRECAEVVDNDDSSYPYDSFGHKLKQHFGVQ